MEYLIGKKLSGKARQFIISSLERSYDVSKVDIKDDRISVSFNEIVPEEEFKKQIDKLIYICRFIDDDKIFDNSKDRTYKKNPQQYLEKSRDVIKISNGMYAFQGNFLKIFHKLNKMVKSIANKYDAIEQEYPTLWPVDLYKKINYFKEFPQQVILCTSPRQDNVSLNNFANQYDKNNDYEKVKVDNNLDEIRFGLEQAVCDCCYYALQNESNFNNTVFTTYNKVFRNEYSKIDSLDRLINFSVRDIMFVGEKDFVLEMQQKLIDDLINFILELDLDCKIESANDPFFTNDSIMKNVFQNAHDLKYEILAKLNFSNSYLAVGSINLHLDFFGRAFNIRLPNGDYVHSGCIGIGFERLVYSLYCQYGHQIENWPDNIREKLGV